MKQDLYIYYSHSDARRHPCPPETETVSFEEMVRLAKSKAFFRKVRSYRDVLLFAPDLETIIRPFFVATICWLLASRRCVWSDARGREQTVNAGRTIREFSVFLWDYVTYRTALRRIEAEVKAVEAWPDRSRALDKTGTPVYLRCDYSYGYIAGGSIGHIAGVVNNLSGFSGLAPVFFTTCEIPTVCAGIPTHLIAGKTEYRNVRDIAGLFFNRTVYDAVAPQLEGKTVAFLYQRSALNAYAGIKLALERGIPFVLEYNGSEVWASEKWGGRRLKVAELSERIEMLTFEKADLIVCVSQPLKDELIERGVSSKKLLVNPNAVDTERYRPDIDGAPVRERYGIDKNEVVIGFIGTFGAWHGAEVLAQAFADLIKTRKGLPPLRLLLIGDGMRMGMVKDIIAREQIAGHCVLTGIVPQEKGPEYLAACDILVSPQVPNPDGSPFFGSPTKLFEYMAMGKAIAASDLDQLGEIIEHEKTGLLCKPGDAASLKDALERLVRDGELRRTLGANARREAEEKHTWSAHVARTLDALTAVLEKKENPQ